MKNCNTLFSSKAVLELKKILVSKTQYSLISENNSQEKKIKTERTSGDCLILDSHLKE